MLFIYELYKTRLCEVIHRISEMEASVSRFLDEVGDIIDKFFGKLCVYRPRKAEGDCIEKSRNTEDKYKKRVITSSTNVAGINHLCVKEQVVDIIATILERHERSSGWRMWGRSDRSRSSCNMIVYIWE
jgi:hypothetical protein